jgi:aarF domain-containing kinase
MLQALLPSLRYLTSRSAPAVAATGLGSASVAYITLSDSDGATAVRRVGLSTRYIVPVLLDWKLHELRVWALSLDADEERQAASRTHTRIAERLRDLALRQGGIYIKGAQHMCAQPIIAGEYVSVLRTLMSYQATQRTDWDLQTFREDTGLRMVDAFQSFDPEPVASASLASVYRATLPDSTPVAVKIQARTVARFLQVDLWTIELYYDLLACLIPGLRLGWLAAETRRHMNEELDFVQERRNSEEAAEQLATEFPRSRVIVPRAFPALSGPRVLTMEWIDGCRIDEVRQRLPHVNVAAVAELVQRVFAAQLFVHGFVHVDPHSANLFVTPTGALAVLDHGIYRRLSDELRVNYARLWLAVLAGNRADIQRCTAALGMPPERWKVVAVMLALAPGMDIPESGNARRRLADDKSAARSLASLTPAQRAAASQRAMALGGGIAAHSAFLESIPRDLLLVLKANNLLRFVNDQLGAPVNRFRIIGEYAQRGAAATSRPSMWLRINTAMAPWLERHARRSADSLSRD